MLQRLFSRRPSSIRGPSSRTPGPVAFGAEPTDLRPVTEIGNGQLLPAYPERSHPVPCYTPDELLATQASLIQALQQASDLDRHDFARLVMPALRNYASYVHLLPASEAHHHFGLGGLLRHGLECAYFASTFCDKAMLGYETDPERSYNTRRRWRLAVLFGALLHDMGKPIIDVGALTPDGDAWSPHDCSLYDWLVERGLPHYHIQWRAGGRYKQHEAFNAVSTYRILPDETIRFICEYGQEPFDTMILALSGRPDPRFPLADYLRDADCKSVDLDLKHNKVQLASAGHGALANLAARMLRTMYGLIESGQWKTNRPSAPVWITPRGTFLLFPSALQEVHDILRQDPSMTSLPSDLNALLDALIDFKRVTTNRVAQAHETRTWNVRLSTEEKGREFVFDTQAILWADEDLVPKNHIIHAEAHCQVLGADGEPIEGVAPKPAVEPATREDVLANEFDRETTVAALARRVDTKRAALDFGPIPPDEAVPLRDRAAELDPAEERIDVAQEAYASPFPPSNAEDAAMWLSLPENAPEGEYLYQIAKATKSDVRMVKSPTATGFLAGRDVVDLENRIHLVHTCFHGFATDYLSIIEVLHQRGWLDPFGKSQTSRITRVTIGDKPVQCVRLNHDMSVLMRHLLPFRLEPMAFEKLDTLRDNAKSVTAIGPLLSATAARALKNPLKYEPEDSPIIRGAFVVYLDQESPGWRTDPEGVNFRELLKTFGKQHHQRGISNSYYLNHMARGKAAVLTTTEKQASTEFISPASTFVLNPDYDPATDLAAYNALQGAP